MTARLLSVVDELDLATPNRSGLPIVELPLAAPEDMAAVWQFLFDRGAVDVTAICLLGTPEGLERVERDMDGHDVTIVLGALDERLNEQGFIVPGLGDAGDRLYGTVGH